MSMKSLSILPVKSSLSCKLPYITSHSDPGNSGEYRSNDEKINKILN